MPDWRKQGQDRVNDRKEGTTLKLEEGVNCIRVMPDKKDLLPDGRVGPNGLQNAPYREFRMHRHIGPDDATCACGKDIEGKGRCWVCDVAMPKLEADPRKAKQLKDVGPQEQFVIQASRFDTNTNKFKLPKLMWLSTGAGIPSRPGTNTAAIRVYSKIVGTRKDYVDPIKGYNLNIERTGQGLKTKYPSIEGDESPSKVPLAVTAAVVSIDSLLPKYDEEDIKSLWFGRPRRDEDKRGGGSSDADAGAEGSAEEYPEGEDGAEDAPMADDEFAEDPAGEEYAEDTVEDAEDLDNEAAVDTDEFAEEESAVEYDDAPEEYSNDSEAEAEAEEPPPPARRRAPPPPPPPARRPAPAAARPPQRAPAPAPARRPAPAPARRPAPAPPARRPAPAATKKPGRR